MAINTIQAGAGIEVNNVVLNTFYTWANGQYGLTSVALFIQSADPGSSCGDVAWAMQTAFEVFLSNLVATPAAFLGSRCVRVIPNTTEKAGVATSTSTGAAGADLMPTQTCGLIGFYTATKGPSGRGRMYIPFPATAAAHAATGLPSAAYLADLQTMATQLTVAQALVSQDTLRNISAFPAIWHRTVNSYNSIRSGIGRGQWATQKRRGDYGRPNPPVIPL